MHWSLLYNTAHLALNCWERSLGTFWRNPCYVLCCIWYFKPGNKTTGIFVIWVSEKGNKLILFLSQGQAVYLKKTRDANYSAFFMFYTPLISKTHFIQCYYIHSPLDQRLNKIPLRSLRRGWVKSRQRIVHFVFCRLAYT